MHMMKGFSKIGFMLAVATLAAAGLNAADDGAEFSVKGGLINPQGDLRNLTQSAIGFGGELGYDIVPTKDMGVAIGFNAGFLSAKGKEKAFETYTAKATYGGVDLIYAIGATPLTIRTGLQLISWDVTSIKPASGTGAQGETGWKFGFRVGGEYRFNKQWTATAMYTFSQWKSDIITHVAVNPSYVSVMAGYKF
jgi:hypothetical protein